MTSRDLTFEVKDYHLKLLRRFFIDWCYDEFGAPSVDPKRPYGNSDVLSDIHEILTGVHGVELTQDQIKKYNKIHKDEMPKALQILTQHLSISVGIYKADWIGNYTKIS